MFWESDFYNNNTAFVLITVVTVSIRPVSLFSIHTGCPATTVWCQEVTAVCFLCVSFKAFFPKRQTIPVRFSKACFKKCFHFVIQKNPIHHPPRDTEEQSVCKKRMIIWSTAKSIYSNCVRISPFTHTQRSPRHVGTQHLYCQTADLLRKRAKHKIDL